MTVIIDGTNGVQSVSGSATLASITNINDTNTGMFFPASETIALATSGSERFRVDSAGNMGLGVTPSAWNSAYTAFQSRNASFFGTTSVTEASVGANVVIAAGGGQYISNGQASIYQQVNGTHIWYTASSGTAGNAISFTQALTLNTSGNLVLQGGTTTASGVGVTFPASQSASSDANCLDDYEEGTFTPTAIGNTTAGITTYATQNGYYTKIGRQVNVTLLMDYTAMTGTGIMVIGGLPFTILNAGQNYPVGPCLPSNLNWTAGTSIVALGIINTSTIYLYCISDDGTASVQQCVNEAADFRITLTYFV